MQRNLIQCALCLCVPEWQLKYSIYVTPNCMHRLSRSGSLFSLMLWSVWKKTCRLSFMNIFTFKYRKHSCLRPPFIQKFGVTLQAEQPTAGMLDFNTQTQDYFFLYNPFWSQQPLPMGKSQVTNPWTVHHTLLIKYTSQQMRNHEIAGWEEDQKWSNQRWWQWSHQIEHVCTWSLITEQLSMELCGNQSGQV